MSYPTVNTTDSIIATLAEWAQAKKQVTPEQYLDAAMKLTLLSTYDADELIDAEQMVAKKKLTIMENQAKRNVAAAETEVEASPEYAALRRLQEKQKRVEEFVRLAKRYAAINDFR